MKEPQKMMPLLRKGRSRPELRERYFVPVARGLEPALLAEMQALGLPEVVAGNGGAWFTGTLEDCYRSNLWLRTGLRVLRVIAEFPCPDDRALYNAVYKLDWYQWLSPEQTLAVRARLGQTNFTHAQYISRKIKDAVVDRFREAFRQRPAVDAKSPDLQIHAWFDQGTCTLSLDSSGDSLFKRGYRWGAGQAPLKEHLAAGLIGLTGWTGEQPFCDFMTGSGTLPIEAALIAANRAPGLIRESFGFMRWPDYQASLWSRLRSEAEQAVRPVSVPLYASDWDAHAIQEARRNAEQAGVAEAIRFTVADFRDRPAPPETGVVLLNPPYGERLGEREGPALPALYRSLGDVLKQRYAGWDAYVFTEHGPLIKSIGLRPSRRTILHNGPLECRLLYYSLYPVQKAPIERPVADQVAAPVFEQVAEQSAAPPIVPTTSGIENPAPRPLPGPGPVLSNLPGTETEGTPTALRPAPAVASPPASASSSASTTSPKDPAYLVHPEVPANPPNLIHPANQETMTAFSFSPIEQAPPDPIIGLTEQFRQDTHPSKVNLGIGVYLDETGTSPILKAVKRAELLWLAEEKTKDYLGMAGSPEFGRLTRELLFGTQHAVLREDRAVTLQTPGGTGALRLGGDFVHKQFPKAKLWLSDPTWANHKAVFAAAGLALETYLYFDAMSNGLRFDDLLATLERIPEGDVVLLHACCHNPTGVDPTPEQWQTLAALFARRNILPFLDCAYQGLGNGLDADGTAVRTFGEAGLTFLVASSFSKSMGLYRERVGALTLVAEDQATANRVLSQVKLAARANYSNPPAHGGKIVERVLINPDLRQEWEAELSQMRGRILEMRQQFVAQLKSLGVHQDFDFIQRQRGMFSFSGISKEQVLRLRNEHGIYLIENGRINVAGMTPDNLPYLCQALAAVLKE